MQVRMQAEGKLAEGKFKKYPNAVKAYGIIARCVTWQTCCQNLASCSASGTLRISYCIHMTRRFGWAEHVPT